jgi:Fe2+ or Zn2+ uptake regulation protein
MGHHGFNDMDKKIAYTSNQKLMELFLQADIAKGLPLSEMDQLVLSYLYKERLFISIDDLWVKLRNQGVKISISSVQLILNRFHRCGILNKQVGEEKKALFGLLR